MEREFTRVNKQFLEAIPILVRNERLIRGQFLFIASNKTIDAEPFDFW